VKLSRKGKCGVCGAVKKESHLYYSKYYGCMVCLRCFRRAIEKSNLKMMVT